MDKALSRRQFVLLGGAALSSVALWGLTGCSSGSTNESSNSSDAQSPELNSEWEQIVEKAKGSTVTFLAWGSGGADAFVQKYWEQLGQYVKDQYDITIEYTEFSQADYQKIQTDIDNNAKPTFDLFWYTGTMIAPFRAKDGIVKDEWVKQLDNYKYLNPDNPYVVFDGAQDTDAAESPFQGCQASLVYSQDEWSHTIPWDQEQDGKKGLFSNYSELAEWVKKYPGKFTYIDLTGQGGFQGQIFTKGILAELTDDGNGSWKPVYDEGDDEATRRQKIQANIDEWYQWSTSSDASEEAFYEKANYVWAYLNDLKPYLMQRDNGVFYGATAPDVMQYVKAGDLAVAFTTCTSIAERVAETPDNYMANPAIYLLQTSIGFWDYAVILKNTEVKEACMVICNAMLNPDQQAYAYQETGNGYNVDIAKLPADDQAVFDDVISKMGVLSPSVEEVNQQSYNDKFGKVTNWLVSGWDSKVNRA